ncbi:hypothetical protein AC249_AIPGENE21124 [Exaiptasia diaphana]|nr:hypothetical protein AC249_AIPGENE21124 [Exaiptasia diaphana]
MKISFSTAMIFGFVLVLASLSHRSESAGAFIGHRKAGRQLQNRGKILTSLEDFPMKRSREFVRSLYKPSVMDQLDAFRRRQTESREHRPHAE